MGKEIRYPPGITGCHECGGGAGKFDCQEMGDKSVSVIKYWQDHTFHPDCPFSKGREDDDKLKEIYYVLEPDQDHPDLQGAYVQATHGLNYDNAIKSCERRGNNSIVVKIIKND